MSAISAGNMTNRDSTMSMVSTASVVPRESTVADSPDGQFHVSETEPGEVPDPLLKMDGVLQAASLVDAAIMQNVYLDKLLLYRDIKIDGFGEEDTLRRSCEGPSGRQSSTISSAISMSTVGKASEEHSSTPVEEDNLSLATVRRSLHLQRMNYCCSAFLQHDLAAD